MEPRWEQYLLRMRGTSENARRYVAGMSFSEFLADNKIQDAIVMNLLNVGETARKIVEHFPAFAAAHPEIPWKSMRGMRNRIAHDYFDLDFQAIWTTVGSDLHALIRVVAAVLEERP
jgi:uncharacterized protein with HEPN domain